MLGAAVAAYLLARLMSRRGRRVGLVTGYLLGAAGAVLAVLAGVVGSMPLLLVGAVLLGSTTAANSGARYAATDLAEEAHTRSGAVDRGLGDDHRCGRRPEPHRPLRRRSPSGSASRALTGPFALGSIGMLAAALIVGLLLRPDPLLLARQAAGVPATEPSGTAWRRAVDAARERPVLGFAVLGMACAHAVMVAVMVMTPLHMEHGRAELRVIGVVISVHVLGMFAFAPLVGMLADRTGRPAVLVEGALVLLASLVLCARSPEGSSWQILVGLFLLGLGWSFATVAASTLIAEHAPLDARTDVQGAADLLMGLTAAAAGGAAGVVVGAWGYPQLAVGAIGLVALVAVAGAGARATTRLRDHPTGRVTP